MPVFNSRRGRRLVYKQGGLKVADETPPPQLRIRQAWTMRQPRPYAVTELDTPEGVSPCRLVCLPTRPPASIFDVDQGFVGLHAGQELDQGAVGYLERRGYAVPRGLPYSAVVAVARLVRWDYAPPKGDPWSTWFRVPKGSEQLYALTDVQALDTPVPSRGYLDFWMLGRAKGVMAQVDDQLVGLLSKIKRRNRAYYYTDDGRLHRHTYRPEGATPVEVPQLDQIRVINHRGHVVLASEAMLNADTGSSFEVYQ